jgi:hypothetical protein
MTVERDWARGFGGFAASPPLRDCAPRNFGRGRPEATGLRPGFTALLFFMEKPSPPRESPCEHSLRRSFVQRPLWMPKN